jgi:hypothetical protein
MFREWIYDRPGLHQFLRKWRGISAYGYAALEAVRVMREAGPVRTLMAFGGAPGDDLLCTVPLRELKRRQPKMQIAMLTRHPALFQGSPDVARVLPKNNYSIEPILRGLGYRCIVPHYTAYDEETDKDRRPEGHILKVMCRQAGIKGDVTVRPYLYLTEAEKQKGKIAARQICVQSSVNGAMFAMKNKEWHIDRMQAAVTALAADCTVIQLGADADTALDHVLDLRGKTTLREAAAILSQSLCFVGLVGFLMHLARAVECRSVIVYGGRELPNESGYVCNTNLTGATECAPCWQHNRCDYNRACMDLITAERVIAATRDLVMRTGTPLEVEIL